MNKILIYFLVILSITTMYAYAAPVSGDTILNTNFENTKISSLILAEMSRAGNDNQKIPVIISLTDDTAPDMLVLKTQSRPMAIDSLRTYSELNQQNLATFLNEEIKTGNARNMKQLWAANAIAIEISPNSISKIAQRPDVARIEPDLKIMITDPNIESQPFSQSSFDRILNNLPMRSTPKDKIKGMITDIDRDYPGNAWSVEWIEAPELWSRGITGTGINVSIIDTGINAQHPDLQGKVVAWKDFTKNIPFNGTSAWHSGKGDNLNNTLTRSFDLTGVTSATLEFNGRYEMEYGYDDSSDQYIYNDVGYVNISTDGGVSWDNLAVYNGVSGYFDDGYLHETLDLTTYVGNDDVLIRFAYVTDETYYWDGWYVDDIKIQEINFFDGAESGTTGWTYVGWDIKDNTVYWPSGNTWNSGLEDYLSNTLEQTFDLSGLTSATLDFTTKYDIESGYDNGYVQVLTGSSWITLATYTGYSDWTDRSVDLGSYVGSDVTVRFLYETDSCIAYEGWYIDDIEIPEIGFYDDVESGPNGWTADGWYILGLDIPYDDNGHGTHVAGTVAGTGASGLNTGVAPGANLMAAKVIDSYGYGSMSDVIRAVEWSMENNADVVSLSLGMNPIDEVNSYGMLNGSETAIENIYVFSNWFEGNPSTTISPTAYQPTYILGGVALFEETHMWEANGYSHDTLTRTFDLTGFTNATLKFSTTFEEWSNNYVGEVQASTDGETWDTLAEYSGYSDWTNDSLPLDYYAGSNVSIRFEFEPYDYGSWQIDNIEISEIGFYDDVEAGNTGWSASGWYIDDISFPVDITNADISFIAPDETQVLGDEAEWLYEGMIPDNIWFYKYTGTTPLQNGEWGLIIDSNFDSNITYETLLLVGYPSDGTDGVSKSLDTAAALGVVPVVAAGNDGILGLHSIRSPGASGNAITVGATEYEMDYIAWFSSRGPVGFGNDETIKPDVVAPGTYIDSTYYLGGYAGWSGTSMATPHVSGAAALLLEADPTLTPAQIKQVLMETAIDLGETGMDNNYGAGRISAYAAVNATVDLPDPIDARPDQYELFAGALIDDMYLPTFIEDQAGDAVGYADIVGVDPNLYSSNEHLYFRIYTSDIPDLSFSELRLYMDTDRATSTGNSVIITELGIDYYIKINGTGGYLYIWDAGEWQLVRNVNIYSRDNYVSVWVPLDAIGENVSSIEMNTVVDSFVPGGTLLDRAPDTGYGTFPWMDVTIDMVGISWNDSSGLPEQGMNITFDVYFNWDFEDGLPPTISMTNTTDTQGMVKTSVHLTQHRNWESYQIIISDETGNEILDDVYTYADHSRPYDDVPFIVPSWKDYYADMNSILPVKITMVTPEWEPYNENVTLVFGYEGDDRGNVSVELTPVDGTIEYDLDLSATDIDENYYNYIEVRVLNGTLDEYDYKEYVGDIDVYDGQRYTAILSPETTLALTGSTVDYLAEVFVSNMTGDIPVSDNLAVHVFWISEVAVKNLNLEPSVINKLDMMRILIEETGKSDNLLTPKEQEKLLEVLRDTQINNMGYNYTTFDINSNANGLAQFNVDVPDDAYYGYIEVTGADYEWYSGESIIIVLDNYEDLFHHPTAPEGGSEYYYLDLYADWDYAIVDGSVIPDENITVNLELGMYDHQMDYWICMPDEDIYLYATTGDVKMVTTDENGEAEINFTAPSIDVLNSSWDERRVQVWGITRLLTPDNEIAVAEDDWAYLGGIRSGGNYSIPYVEINNNNLDIYIEFKDSTWTDTTNVPTVLNVFKSAQWYYYSSSKDLKSDYINSPISTWQTSIPLTEYGTYSVSASTEYLDFWGYGGYRRSSRRATYTPFDVSSDIHYVYPRNIYQPINVTVHDWQGNPVSGASVYIIEQDNNWYYYEDSDIPPIWNYIDLATTDSNGMATLTLETPDYDTYVVYRIGGATPEFMFPYVESGYFRVEAPSDQPDLNAIITMPSSIEKGDTVDINVEVNNIGGVDSIPSSLHLYRDSTLIEDFTIPAISAQGSQDVSTTWVADTSGRYTWKAVADATDTNDESNEDNNEYIKNVVVGQPDLIVSSITPPDVINKGLPVDITVTVENIDIYTAGETTFNVTVNETVIDTVNVPALMWGDSFTDSVSWTPDTAGIYTIQANADPANIVVESNETNNSLSIQVEVVDKPDLTPEIQVDPETLLYQTTNITFKVYNVGLQQADNTSMDIFIGGILNHSIDIPPLAPSENWSYNLAWTPQREGEHVFRAIVDPENLVDEADETNNETASTTRTGYIDLVTSIASHSVIADGENATIWVSVRNNGNMASEPTNVSVYVNETLFTNLSIRALNANSGTSTSFVWTPPDNGTYVFKSIVDPDDTVFELYEENNEFERIVQVNPYEISAWYLRYPTEVYADNYFYVITYFTSSQPAMASASIDLEDGLSTTETEKTVTARNGNYNTVWWLVKADEIGTYNFSVTVAANGKSSTVGTNDTVWVSPDGWNYNPHGPVDVIEQTVIVKDLNVTPVLYDNGTANLTYRVFDVNMTDQSGIINIIAGTEGRLLAGLQYLSGYPHGCPEQVISPALAALRTKQYYEDRGVLTDDLNNSMYLKVEQGVSMMSPNGGHNPQQSNGGWAWGTGTPTMFYSVYTTYGMSSILMDTNYSHLVHDASIDLNKSSLWIVEHQNTDGSWSGYGYINGNVPMTGFVMLTLGQSMPYLNSTMADLANESMNNAANYLMVNQISTSGPDYGGWNMNGYTSAPDAYSTSLALMGLTIYGNDLTQVVQSIEDGQEWLLNAQLSDGSWSKYPGHDSSSYSYYGSMSEATAYAIIALNATDIPTDNESIIRGISYLVGVYQDEGSWGSTKSTQMAINALTMLQTTEYINLNITIVLEDVLGETHQFNDSHSNERIVLTDEQMNHLGSGNHTVNITTEGEGRAIVGVVSKQLVPIREALLKVPHEYIDPIADNFTLEISLPDDIVENDTVSVNAMINNSEASDQNVMILDIPLPDNITFPSTRPDNITYYIKDGTKTEVVHMYNVSENKLFIYPGSDDEISVSAESTETYYFNLTFEQPGEKTVEATVYPMYNPTLMALDSATAYIKGYGNLTLNAVNESDSAISVNITLGEVGSSGSNMTFEVVEGSYNLTISQDGYKPVITSLGLVAASEENLTARMVKNISEPTVVLTETEATALEVAIEENGLYVNYTFNVTSPGGITVIAMEEPPNLTFNKTKVNGVIVDTIEDGNRIYMKADLTGDSLFEVVYTMTGSDIIPPIINITSPVDGWSTKASSVTVLGYVDGTGSFPNVTVNGYTVVLDELVGNAGNYSAPIELLIGKNTINATATDESNYTESVLINVTRSTDSSNGGSGSSGGGSSRENYYNIVLSETDRQNIYKNSGISYSFDLEGNIVRHINFTALNSAGEVAAKVEILKNTSTLVSTPPPDEVFRNLNIWVGNAGWATERNIVDATVVFTVEKSWITGNNIDEYSIALHRYSGDTWHKLVTRKIAEDANSLQFEAETTGFSPFAVTGRKTTGEPGGEGVIEPTGTAEKTPTPTPTPTEEKGMPGFGLFAGLSVLLIAVQLLRKKD